MPRPAKFQTPEEVFLPPESLAGRMDGLTAEQLCTRHAATYAGCAAACSDDRCRSQKQCQAARRCESRLWSGETDALARHLSRFWTFVVNRRKDWLDNFLGAREAKSNGKIASAVVEMAFWVAEIQLRRRRLPDLTWQEKSAIHETVRRRLEGE